MIGGGPAGSFFCCSLLDLARSVDLALEVDVYEPRDFSRPGPAGCNHCGGIISESLVQILATEGIILGPSVVQRGIDSYTLHMDVGSVRIATPLQEKRIAAVHRGAGPRGLPEKSWESHDGFLQSLAVGRGARVLRERVEGIDWGDDRPRIRTRAGTSEPCDLIVGAVGVNSAASKLFEGLGIGYRPPRTTKTYICEILLGRARVAEYLGSSMHIFLLNIPRLEFAAFIPKGDYVTVCLLGEEIDNDLVQSFLNTEEVKACLPSDPELLRDLCRCGPQINVRGAAHPFADRLVLIGDCAVTRLYKDGIGAAHRTAKAAAMTAVLHGISAGDFQRHCGPIFRKIERDNAIGKFLFAFTRQVQRRRFARRAIARMVAREQRGEGNRRRMSLVLWDMFTGSAPYREVFRRTLHPAFVGRFLGDIAISLWPLRGARKRGDANGRRGVGQGLQER